MTADSKGKEQEDGEENPKDDYRAFRIVNAHVLARYRQSAAQLLNYRSHIRRP